MSTGTVTRYHLSLRLLHWMVAVLVLLQLAIGGLVLANLPNTAEKLFPLLVHVSVGLLIGLLMVVRLIVRLTTNKPPPAVLGNRVLNGLRRLTHFLFYAVVLSMISTGIGMAFLAGLFPILFGSGGALPDSFDAFPPQAGHELFATVLLVLVGLHLAGVLYHQLILKDHLLSRMGFGPSRRGGAIQPAARPDSRS